MKTKRDYRHDGMLTSSTPIDKASLVERGRAFVAFRPSSTYRKLVYLFLRAAFANIVNISACI